MLPMTGSFVTHHAAPTHGRYDSGVPFGGYKESGLGRDKGEYALSHYTQVKAIYQQLVDPAWR